MEILKTIWTALTTENVMLTNLLILPLFYLDAFVTMLLFSTILDIKSTKKQKITYILTLTTLSYICRFVIPTPYVTFINMILLPVCVIFIFKTSILKGILAQIIPFAFSLILETLFEKIFFIITGHSWSTLLYIPLYRIIIICLIYTCIYLLYLLTKKLNFSLSVLETMNKKNKYLLYVNCILAIIVIVFQFYLINYYNDNFPIIVSILNLFCLFAYFIISLIGFTNTTKLDSATTSLEEATLYNKTLELMYDNTRAFKHDFGNIMQGLGGYIANNDIEGLKQFYSQLALDCSHINNLSTLNPERINNSAIYNVLAEKYHKADAQNIKITLESTLDFSNLQMKIYEFTRIIGILMDNAIEATSECENKIIHLYFGDSSDKRMQLVIIENTYKNKDVNTETIFKKGYSTKAGNSGLGLWEVRQLLTKNHNLNLFTSKTNDFFRQQLEIYYE